MAKSTPRSVPVYRPEIEQKLKDYSREFDSIRGYFPEADIQTVDGAKSHAVAKQIRKVSESRQK